MAKRFKTSTEVQSLLFDKSKWTPAGARKWLADHGYKVPAVDTTADYHRFRQFPPFQYKKGTFRTIQFGAARNGIKAVIAVPRQNKSNANPTPKRTKKTTGRVSRIPALLVDIADARAVELEDGSTLRFALKDRYALCCNRKGDEIWIMSRKRSKRVSAEGQDANAERLYERFTGYEADEVGNLVQFPPITLERVGRAISVKYRSDKFSRNSHDYLHPFKFYPTVSVDRKKNPRVIALRGGKIQVTTEGIKG